MRPAHAVAAMRLVQYVHVKRLTILLPTSLPWSPSGAAIGVTGLFRFWSLLGPPIDRRNRPAIEPLHFS